MSSGRPNRIARNLQAAYDDVISVSVPERLAALLDEIDGPARRKRDDDLDGIGAEPPQRPRGGPKSNGAAAGARPSPREAER